MEIRPFSDITFQKYLSEEKLMGSRCKKCGKLYAPPRPLCISCYATDQEWAPMKGIGKLAAFTCIAVVPKSMSEEGHGRENPYCVGVVELDEGPRVVARIVGVDTLQPETIIIGTPMSINYLHRNKGGSAKTILAFGPATT
jgi:uncharacterized protein